MAGIHPESNTWNLLWLINLVYKWAEQQRHKLFLSRACDTSSATRASQDAIRLAWNRARESGV